MKPPEFGQPELSNNESEAIHNNNIVPISIEYILFGCNEINEELNTLLFKSVQQFIRQTCRFNGIKATTYMS
jgi:hypothetical protein